MERWYRTLALLAVTIVLLAALGGVHYWWQSPNYDCPRMLHVSSEYEAGSGSPIHFDTLSEQRQEEFRNALRGESVTVRSTSEAWIDTSQVRYRAENYTVSVVVC